MHIDIQDVGPCKKTIKIEIDAERVKSEITDAFAEARKNVKLPGFRSGKTPKALIEKRFGKEINEDVKGKLLGEAYDKAIKDYNLKPVSDPIPEDVEYEPKEGLLKFTITVEILPEFDLPEYKGIKVTRPEVKVEKEDIDSSIKALFNERGQWQPVEGGKVEEADLVLADVVLKVDGKEVAKKEDGGVSPEHNSVVGIEVKDLKDSVVGMSVGDEVTVSTVLPAKIDWYEIPEGDEGKAAEILIKAKDIKRLKLPEMKDLLGELDYDDEEELREEVEKSLIKRAESDADAVVENSVLKKVIDAAEFETPEDMIEKEAKILEERKRIQLSMQNVPVGEIENQLKDFSSKSVDEVRASFKAQLVMARLAEKEKIFCTEDDIGERLNTLGMMYGKSGEEMLAFYEQRNMINTLREEIRAEKVRKMLRGKAEIVDKLDDMEEDKSVDSEKQVETKDEDKGKDNQVEGKATDE